AGLLGDWTPNSGSLRRLMENRLDLATDLTIPLSVGRQPFFRSVHTLLVSAGRSPSRRMLVAILNRSPDLANDVILRMVGHPHLVKNCAPRGYRDRIQWFRCISEEFLSVNFSKPIKGSLVCDQVEKLLAILYTVLFKPI